MRILSIAVQLVCTLIWVLLAQLVPDRMAWLRYSLYAMTALGAVITTVSLLRSKKPTHEGDIDDLAD